MLYIPDRFYHAILNLGEAVAVIGEFCAEGPGCIPTNSAGKGICRESVHCAMCLPTCQQHFGCVVGSTQPRSLCVTGTKLDRRATGVGGNHTDAVTSCVECSERA